MATSKFFTATAKPIITASIQYGGTPGTTDFANGDVLFDWTAFDIPKGSCLLRSVTTLVRPKGDATPTDNRFPFELVFSSTNTVSLGTIAEAPDHRPNNDILGRVEFESENYVHSGLGSTAVATSGKGSNSGTDVTPMVLTPDPTTGTNVGYDTLYVGAIARDAFDWTTINRINDANIATVSPGTTLVMSGTSMDIQEHFAVGDVLHAHDDAVIGTVASITNSTTLELTEAIETGVLVHQDFVFNASPIILKMSFER